MHNLRLLSCFLVRFVVFLPILCLISFSIASAAFAGSALTSASARAEAAKEKALAAQGLTEDLMGLVRRHARADAVSRSPIAAEMVALAEARQALLAELMAEDPAEVLRLAIPDHVAGRMPAAVQDKLEQWLELEGELEVLHVDAQEPGESFYEHIMTTPAGERVSLHFAAGLPNTLTGNEVRAKGVFLAGVGPNRLGETDGSLALGNSEDLVVLACCEGSAASSSVAAPELSNTFGEQRTLVILVNFQDLPEEPWTLDEVNSLFFNTVSDFFFENSYDQTWLSGDVFGWYTLPLDARCERTEIQRLAEEAASNNGADLSGYTRFVYAWPTHACGWSGLADVGANPSHAYFNGALNLRIVAHELGHNFGLYHSHGLNCNDGVLGVDCQQLDYGDRMDVMGARPAHFNAFQKERLGWLGYGVSPEIATVATDGTHQIAPYELPANVATALKIPRGLINPETGEQTWFYLEYRQPLGFDGLLNDSFLNRDNIFGGVLFHHETEGDPVRSFLLDMTPNSDDGTFTDLDDAALVAGGTYTDPDSGITISTDWADASGATVSVSFDGAANCTQANPTVSLTPSESQWVNPGTLVTYTVTVTSNDGGTCASTSFDLLASVPSGWSAVFADPTLALAPAASETTTLDVTSSALAADGFYDVVVTVENNVAPSYFGSETTTYVVSSSGGNNPPVAEDDSASTMEAEPVAITVLANDFDPDGDPLTVTSASQGAKGLVTVNPDGTITYTPDPKSKGRDSFAYTVSDGFDSVGAKVSVSVKKGGTGKGKP